MLLQEIPKAWEGEEGREDLPALVVVVREKLWVKGAT